MFLKPVLNHICSNASVPSAVEYFRGLPIPTLLLLVGVSVVALCVLILCIVQTTFVHRHVSDAGLRSKLYSLSALYPLTAICFTANLFVPRSMPITEVLIALYLAYTVHTFVHYFLHVLGGDLSHVSKALQDTGLNMRVPPLACCCACLPSVKPTQRNLSLLTIAIQQVVFVKVVFTVFESVYQVDRYGAVWILTSRSPFVYVSAFNILSNVISIYAFNILLGAIAPLLPTHPTTAWFRLAQFTVILYNLQGNVFRWLGSFGLFECTALLAPTVRAARWSNAFLIIEVCLLSCATLWFLRASRNAVFDRHQANIPPAQIYTVRRQPGLACFAREDSFTALPDIMTESGVRQWRITPHSITSSPAGNQYVDLGYVI